MITQMKQELFEAAQVFTPLEKILVDVKTFLFPEIADDELVKLQQMEDKWRKIVRLVERLEFVEHLKELQLFLTKKETLKSRGEGQGYDFALDFERHDFAGMPKDVESLRIYLLIAAIDEIMEDERREDFAAWLSKNWPTDGLVTKNDLIKQYENYNLNYGMTKGFHRAFKEVDAKIVDKWLENFCAIKLNKKSGEIVVTAADVEAFDSLAKDERLKGLVDALAECRNSFTHRACRQFECDTPIGHRNYDSICRFKDIGRRWWLVRRTNESPLLMDLLEETISSVAKNHLLMAEY